METKNAAIKGIWFDSAIDIYMKTKKFDFYGFPGG